ncbi:MAG TPA: MFS transporter [Burkholderiaceae bacterium]|nr:MFS transporter [Burkholderiaceae bacterium]
MSTHGQAESQKPRPAKKISKPAASSRPSARRPRGRGKYPDGLPRPRRYWAVLTLMSVLVIVVLDSTMVNVALPTIAADLSIDPAAVVRVVIAYNVTVVVTLLIFSSIAERIGFRLMFGIGVGLFGFASLASALAGSLMTLLLARIAQGLGASMLMCLFGGLMRNIYPLRRLAMGISLNASLVGLTAVLGPTIGAWILALASWPWIFFVNLPICAGVYLGVRFLPDVPRSAGRFDWVAAVLSIPALGLVIVGLDALGKTPLFALGCLAISGWFGTTLWRRSWAQKTPLVPVDLLRIVGIRYAVGASMTMFAAQMAGFVALPFYFLEVLRYSYTELGIAMGAWAAGTAIMAPLAAYFSERYSVAVLCIVGAFGVCLGMAMILSFSNVAGAGWYLFAMFVGGIGFGFFQTPNNRALLAGAPRRRSGAAGGLQAVTRVFGQGVGMGLVAMVFAWGGAMGPQLGIAVALVCALLALGINVLRELNPVQDAELV